MGLSGKKRRKSYTTKKRGFCLRNNLQITTVLTLLDSLIKEVYAQPIDDKPMITLTVSLYIQFGEERAKEDHEKTESEFN